MTKYKKLRLMKDDTGLWYIEKNVLGLFWWPVIKTYNVNAVKSFLDFSELDYNHKTGHYERLE